MKPKVSIIIVNFNTKQPLKRCLQSILSSTVNYQPSTLEVIVVDNGSSDGSAEMVASGQWLVTGEKNKKSSTNHQPPITLRLIKNQQNLGFAKAVNQGLQQAQGEFIFLLNSDVIVKPGAIEKMVDFVKKHPEAGVVGGRLLNPDDSIQGSCYHLPTVGRIIKEFWFSQKNFSVTQKYAPTGDKAVEVEAVTGAVFLIPKKVIEKVGFFDERYFMYFEDLDYCRRVRQAGFKVFYLPSAEFIHYHGLSGKNIPQKTHQWLVESSKIYHGKLKYYLITFLIWLGQKWQKFGKR